MIPEEKFDSSMGINRLNRLYLKVFLPEKYQQYQLFKYIYNQNIDANNNQKGAIPQIIHQIWVGSNNIPKQYQYYQSTWKKFHPKWDYKLWTNQDIDKFDESIQKLFRNARSFAEQADILRLEILKKYGGVYIDMDTECFAALDSLVSRYNFMAVTASTDTDFEVTNSLIASVQDHPIILDAIDYLDKNWNKVEEKFDSSNKYKTFHGMARRRTMFPLEYAVTNYLTNNSTSKDVIVLPVGYCNPFYKNFNNLINKILTGEYKYTITDERICIHFNRKYLSLLPHKDFLLTVFNGNYLNKYLFQYVYGRNILNRIIEDSYEKNAPSKIEFSVPSKTPLTIHLVNLQNKDLTKIANEWTKLNPDFTVKIWHKEQLKDFNIGKSDNKEVEEFIFAAAILAQNGGVYVAGDQTPRDGLYELCSKYKFFSYIKHKSSLSGNLEISNKILGGAADQKILLEISDSLKEIPANNWELDKLITKNYYKFWMIDGPAIALP